MGGRIRIPSHLRSRACGVRHRARGRGGCSCRGAIGRLDQLRELIEADPESVHARGGDGQTPLHFARTVEIAAYLLDHGADIDALDIDHESTPAQWMLGDRAEVARYLVDRGCTTDILLAAAVGHVESVRKHLDADPDSIRVRASEEWFPMVNPKAGGKIYRWTLGYRASVYQAAAKSGHADVLSLLMERSPLEAKLIAACWLHDGASVAALKASASRHRGEALRGRSHRDRPCRA